MFNASRTLVGSRPIRDRVKDAAVSSLLNVRPEEIVSPQDRADFAVLKDRLTSVKTGSRGVVIETCDSMSEDELADVARKTIELFVRILGGL